MGIRGTLEGTWGGLERFKGLGSKLQDNLLPRPSLHPLLDLEYLLAMTGHRRLINCTAAFLRRNMPRAFSDPVLALLQASVHGGPGEEIRYQEGTQKCND